MNKLIGRLIPRPLSAILFRNKVVTLRAYCAVEALHAIISRTPEPQHPDEVVRQALDYADRLIQALEDK